jgi:hypothetical protein
MQGGDGGPVEAAVEAFGAKSCGLSQDPLFINAKIPARLRRVVSFRPITTGAFGFDPQIYIKVIISK